MANAPRCFAALLLGLTVVGVVPLGARSACAQTEEKALTHEQIGELVGNLVTPQYRYDSIAKLKAVGRRATPALVLLLNDTKRCSAIQESTFNKRPWLENVVYVLSLDHAPDVVAPLTKLMESEEPVVRAAAARGLGRVASKECIAPVLKALADSDPQTVDGPITGIKWAMDEKKTSPEFLTGIFPGLEKLVRDSEREPNRYLARLMVAIDPERSARVFESDAVLRIGGPQTFYALSAINKSGAKLDREKLLRFLAAIRPLVTDEDHKFEYCAALQAYGVNPDGNAEPTLRAELKSKNKIVALGAADGLAAMAGVFDPAGFVLRRYEKVGFDGLTPVQRNYFLGSDGYSGFRYYFENERGDHWKEFMEALDAIGAVEQAKTFRQAVALFAPEKPDTDDVKRRDQMDKFTPEQMKKLGELSKSFEQCEPQIGVLLALYSAAHPKELRD